MRRIKAIYLLILICILTNGIRTTVDAASWEYKWDNTVVHVPVGDEINNYTKIPVAHLYKNENLISDAYINYLTEGDWLYYLKDIDTNKVGTYYVWYKAFENDKYRPGTCKGYKCKITFIVEDNIKPTLDIIDKEVGLQRRKENNKEEIDNFLLNNVIATDNYSKCNIIFSHNIDPTKKGRYEVKVSALDSSNNRTSDNFYVNVFDDKYPIITINTLNNVIKVSRSSNVNIKDYFKAYDEIDGDISNKIIYPSFDLNALGVTAYEVSVENSSGNKTTLDFLVDVIDDVIPEIVLTSNNVVLDYKTNFYEFDFNKYLIEIKDDAKIDYDNFKISHNLVNQIGNYYIIYSYTDGINLVTNQIDVKLLSFKNPTLELTDVNINLNDNVNLNNYVYVYDESDNFIRESVQIDDSNVDYKKAGVYFADVYCINSSGLSNSKKLKITIANSPKSDNTVLILIASIGFSIIGLIFAAYFICKHFKNFFSKKISK